MMGAAPSHAGTSRWLQTSDPNLVVEIRYNTSGNPNFILWREDTGFAGWFTTNHLDRLAPFTSITRPDWATHKEGARQRATTPKTEKQLSLEMEHAFALETLIRMSQEAQEALRKVAFWRDEVADLRAHLRSLEQ